MRYRKRLLYLPVISIASLLALLYIIFVFPPSYKLSIINLQLSIIPIGFLLSFVFLWSLIGFIFANKTQGLLIAALPTVYLILRFFHLTQTLFLVMLIIIFAGLELLFFRKRQPCLKFFDTIQFSVQEIAYSEQF